MEQNQKQKIKQKKQKNKKKKNKTKQNKNKQKNKNNRNKKTTPSTNKNKTKNYKENWEIMLVKDADIHILYYKKVILLNATLPILFIIYPETLYIDGTLPYHI